MDDDASTTGHFLLDVRDLSKKFSDKPDSNGLSNLEFGLKKGEIMAIIGESGSGKSTLLQLLYGLLQPDAGEITFQGTHVLGPHEKLIPGHGAMRLVSQHFDDLNTFANVWDNVASRLSNTDLTSKEEKTQHILERLKIDHLAQQRIVELSGGEKQRVAIARALVTQPEILLMDEPFNQVDAAFRDQLQHDIVRIVEETGLTVIIVSHDPTEVMGLADYLLILRNGKIVAEGNPIDLYLNPSNAYIARMLAKSNILSAEQANIIEVKDADQKIAIHPEWIEIRPDRSGKFKVERILYRGFYHEVSVQYQDLILRVYQMGKLGLQKGQRVALFINRFSKIKN